jgi:uncharacterized protein YbaA (DUF1428 family)
MRYVDGFVIPIPQKNIKSYRALARKAGKVWMEHGALNYCECVGDDLAPAGIMPIAKHLKLKRGETVVFSWISYKSRTHRDRVNAKVMKDARLAAMCPNPMPFDIKRMIYAGFKTLVEY